MRMRYSVVIDVLEHGKFIWIIDIEGRGLDVYNLGHVYDPLLRSGTGNNNCHDTFKLTSILLTVTVGSL